MPKKIASEIYTTVDTTQAQRGLVLKLNELGRVDVMYEVGNLTAKFYNKYVPKGSTTKGDRHPGALRDSVRVYAGPHRYKLSWGNTTRTAKYAGYQFRGKVFSVNRPIFDRTTKTVKGWYSTKGVRKTETTRELGVEHDWEIKHKGQTFRAHFGYTTPGTHHHWTEEARKDWSEWRKFRLNVTSLLRKKLKESK